MDDFMIWAIPLAFFVCVAAVQARRRRWQNALCAALAAGIFLVIMARRTGPYQRHASCDTSPAREED